jgi:hypothetical protein
MSKLLLALAVLGGAGALARTQLPEIRRYLRVRKM